MKRIILLYLLAFCLILMAGCNSSPAPSSASTSESSSCTTAESSTASAAESTTASATEDTTPTSQSTSREPPASSTPLPQTIPNALSVSFSGFGASSVLTLKNLRTDRAVQQIAFYEENGDTYVFVTQRIDNDTYLTRCRVNTAQRVATLIDSVKLANFGHGESMDISYHNGKLYLFLGYSANTVNDSAWCREVVRLCYDRGTITDKKIITGFQYTTQSGDKIFKNATPYRVNFGLDDTADQIAFYARCDTSNTGKDIQDRITTYRLSALHQALDSCDGTLNLKTMGSAYLASTGNVTRAKILSNGSFQGLEVDANGVIWITGGVIDTKPQLTSFNTSRTTITRNKIQDITYMVSAKLGAQDYSKTTTYVEIESIKYYKGSYYCVFNPAGDLEQNHTEIYQLLSR